MKRTQLYLEEGAWRALRVRSRQEKTTISELVRAAVREKYLESPANRAEAMKRWVGVWRDRDEMADVEAYVRRLRRGRRLKRLAR
ncbi:MAG TPA: CopG family transcriptional regulator [Terriglobia bacterium]|nr:CopG family transcriptional regulator [Terriglobia bacterium]